MGMAICRRRRLEAVCRVADRSEANWRRIMTGGGGGKGKAARIILNKQSLSRNTVYNHTCIRKLPKKDTQTSSSVYPCTIGN